MTGLVDRIERLRREGALDAQRARLAELHAWVEETYPGTLSIARNAQGELLIDPPLDDLLLLDEQRASRDPAPR